MSAGTPPAAPSAAALERALGEAGIGGRVEARERLAVLVLHTPADLADPVRRRHAVRLATEHGFTHLALELAAAPAGAPGHPAGAPLPRA